MVLKSAVTTVEAILKDRFQKKKKKNLNFSEKKMGDEADSVKRKKKKEKKRKERKTSDFGVITPEDLNNNVQSYQHEIILSLSLFLNIYFVAYVNVYFSNFPRIFKSRTIKWMM